MEHPLYITGNRVRLRPATLEDRDRIYRAAAHSDITDILLGHPDWNYTPLLSFEAFCGDYQCHYFDDSNPEAGRCFVIEAGETPVGQINYNAVDKRRRQVELDMWLFAQEHCGKGYGSEALGLLSTYVHEHFNVLCCFVKPSAANTRAVRAYEKAGFKQTTLNEEGALRRYGEKECFDTVYLVKAFSAAKHSAA
jgi:RimJ/RimL family protein N-acetyltransferase